jgi:hypothetical protein
MTVPKIEGEHPCSGIYKIVFGEKWFYIGRSIDLYTRFKCWNITLNKSNYVNCKIAKLPKELRETARAEIIEYCDKEKTKEREEFYIKKNIDDPSCLNFLGGPWTEEMKAAKQTLAPEFKPLSILKTEGEWEIITAKLAESGKKDLSVYIRAEVRKLNISYCQNPQKFFRAPGEKIYKRPHIPLESYNKLKIIADQMKKPVSTIVDMFIIQPLLMPKP